ncbi:MAG: hypothetical protein ACFFDQ_11575, partial [Candidatus Thorarchaeota archaeon]
YILFYSSNLWLKSMGSVWLSKKAFLYFGGAAVILIGGAIVLMAPYHYVNYAVTEHEQRPFEIWDLDGYYPQLEISVALRVINSTTVNIDFVFHNNATAEVLVANMTLDEDNVVETPDTTLLQGSITIDIPPGNYTITVDRIAGAGMIDLGFNQASDSRLFIVVGGAMNIIGLVMAISGYFVAGSFLPSDTDTIVEWGYENREEEEKDQ